MGALGRSGEMSHPAWACGQERSGELRGGHLEAKRVQALGEIAAACAHDLSNLMAIILGETALMRHQLSDGDSLPNALARIDHVATTAAAMARQILAFRSPKPTIGRELDLNGRILALEWMLRRILGTTIQLQFKLSDPVWSVDIEPSKLDQVLLNLVANARDAMPLGGTLTITSHNQAAGRDAPQPNEPGGDCVTVTVKDTGKGIPARLQSRLFDRSFTTKGPQHGLGLATCRAIMAEARGLIQVDSVPGEGATFTLVFPRADGNVTADDDTSVHAVRPVRPAKLAG